MTIAINFCAGLVAACLLRLPMLSFAEDLVMRNAPAMDRVFPEIRLDLLYNLHIPQNHWANNVNHTFKSVMQTFHGYNIWEDTKLPAAIDSIQLSESIHGSALQQNIWKAVFIEKKPKILLEVGVFMGLTSCTMAQFMSSLEGMEDSFVISMDTWLLDLRFVWDETHKSKGGKYFEKGEVAGNPDMYFRFLRNVIRRKMQNRIIPIRTSSLNGAMALIAHNIRPDFIYVDASHANPDVYIDFENFYQILRPGGTMAIDDIHIAAVKASMENIETKFKIAFTKHNLQAFVTKPLN